MLVSDWMTRTPVTLAPEAPLSTAVALLREHRIRHLPVVSGGKVCGISSDRDLKLATPFPLTDPCAIHLSQVYDRPVFEVMTTEVITVGPGDSIMEAARVMRRRKISGLPVVYNDHLIGILTESDLLDAFLSIGESP
jgi:acetoin utilization protein AcuB